MAGLTGQFALAPTKMDELEVAPDMTEMAVLPPLERLPFDLFDRLLFLVPTADDLKSALLASPRFYEAYSVHPKEVLVAVLSHD